MCLFCGHGGDAPARQHSACPRWTRPFSDHGFVRLLGWWYICIGLAFVALAGRAFVSGGPGVWLRVVVAVGFVLLGIAELRRRRA